MTEIAKFIFQFLEKAYNQYKFKVGSLANFEASFFGYCQQTKKLQIFHYKPEQEDGVFMLKCKHYENLHETSFVYLGENSEATKKMIIDGFTQTSLPGRDVRYAPRWIIEELIEKSEQQTIGGSIQFGYVDRHGFNPFFKAKPVISGNSSATMEYLGYDLFSDIKMIDNTWFSLTAMT